MCKTSKHNNARRLTDYKYVCVIFWVHISIYKSITVQHDQIAKYIIYIG
jgi:hypothetical protein